MCMNITLDSGKSSFNKSRRSGHASTLLELSVSNGQA